MLSGDGYPEYRRRGRVVAQKNGQQIDDRWVVPYNPYLLETFDCHINCEVAAHKRLSVGRMMTFERGYILTYPIYAMLPSPN